MAHLILSKIIVFELKKIELNHDEAKHFYDKVVAQHKKALILLSVSFYKDNTVIYMLFNERVEVASFNSLIEDLLVNQLMQGRITTDNDGYTQTYTACRIQGLFEIIKSFRDIKEILPTFIVCRPENIKSCLAIDHYT